MTEQEGNAKKSVAFTTQKKDEDRVTLSGTDIPIVQEFRVLGSGFRLTNKKGTVDILKKRIGKAQVLLERVGMAQKETRRRALIIASLVVSAALFGVEVADITLKDLTNYRRPSCRLCGENCVPIWPRRSTSV